MIPDAESIVARYLRAYADVAALDTRIVSKTPGRDSGGLAKSWVRYTLIDAANQPSSPVEHLIDNLMQFDCYPSNDGGQPEATLLARTVRAALDAMKGGTHYGAVVTNVRFAGMFRSFDPAVDRDRVSLTSMIYMHNA